MPRASVFLGFLVDKMAKLSAEDSWSIASEKIIPQVIEDEMKRAYIDYAMSVIVGRALPDIRDGLKPVHRRVLYSMNQLGLQHTKSFRKCALIVGDVLGKYHPHGDQAVYDSLVRMAQEFSLRYPLVHGHGNFGSIDGDNAAAYRYTEAKLAKIADEILADIDKETVDFVDNFDGTIKEPWVMPSKIPNLLVNGSTGIAVGMATNIPPHNLAEICRGIIRLIDKPESSVQELLQDIKGPDFPTGGIVQGKNGLMHAYMTGRGKIRVVSVLDMEERKGRRILVVKEIPYMINKSQLVEEIADMIRDKRIEGVSDLRDESNKDGIRIVLELKESANPELVKNQLLQNTRCQDTFSIIFLSLVNNEPRILPLKSMLLEFLDFRKDVVRRRTAFDLRKAEDRQHIVEGLLICLTNIDAVVDLLKKAKDSDDAKKGLAKMYGLSEKQCQAVLDMRLARLTSLEQTKLRDEHNTLTQLISDLKDILASEKRIMDIIKQELMTMEKDYGDRRRTTISDVEMDFDDFDPESLIAQEDQFVTLTNQGYIKRLPKDAYKVQRRGGKGVIGSQHDEKDFVEQVFLANTHSFLLLFTNKGKVHWVKVHEIPESTRYAKGKAVVNLVELEKEEKVTSIVPVREFTDGLFLLMSTRQGVIKKTEVSAYSHPRQGGIKAIDLDEGDELITVALTDETKFIILATKNGLAVRFEDKDIRAIGRTARGVRGIRLKDKDVVIGMVVAGEHETLLTITENGYGKKSEVAEYRVVNRGGQGVRNIICSERNGGVVSVKAVSDEDELIIMSKNGIVLRMHSKGMNTIGRNTQGVRVMKLEGEDKVVSCEKIAQETGEKIVQENGEKTASDASDHLPSTTDENNQI
jgi:DNA gyrase subunit A